MSDPASTTQWRALAAGGAAFLALAVYFLWRDLDLPRELVLLAATLLAGTASLLGRPRRWPLVAPAALMGAAAVAGLWFLAEKGPAVLPALAVALGTSAAAVVRGERGDLGSAGALAHRLRWYGLGVALIAASSAFYFHFLTTGVAVDSVARRLIPTVVWLALGLALFIAGRLRAQPAMHVGLGLVAIAVSKAVVYDTTHLHGSLRVVVLASVGVLLLFAASVVRRSPQSSPRPVLAPGGKGAV